MSNCHRTRDLMGPYLYGDLQDEELSFVEAHLATCPECRAEFAAARSAIALVPRNALDPSDDTRARVSAAVQRRAAEALSARRIPPSAAWLRTCGFAVVTLVVGILVGYNLRRGPVPPPNSTAPPAVSSDASTRAVRPRGDVGGGRDHSMQAATASPARQTETEVAPGRHEAAVMPRTSSPGRRPRVTAHPPKSLVQAIPVLLPPRPLGIDDVRMAEAVQLEVVR